MKKCIQGYRKIRSMVGVAGLCLVLSACGGGGTGDNLGAVNTGGGTAVAAQAAGSASLSWRPPAERVDGENLPLTEIAGYRIYYGTRSGKYKFQVPAIDDAYTTSVVINDLPAGTYYFVMTTVDVNGLESGYSSEAVKVVQS